MPFQDAALFAACESVPFKPIHETTSKFSAQFERAFVVGVVDADRAELVPEIENRSDDDGDAQADGEEDSIGGKEDKQSDDGANGDDECGTAFERTHRFYFSG